MRLARTAFAAESVPAHTAEELVAPCPLSTGAETPSKKAPPTESPESSAAVAFRASFKRSAPNAAFLEELIASLRLDIICPCSQWILRPHFL